MARNWTRMWKTNGNLGFFTSRCLDNLWRYAKKGSFNLLLEMCKSWAFGFFSYILLMKVLTELTSRDCCSSLSPCPQRGWRFATCLQLMQERGYSQPLSPLLPPSRGDPAPRHHCTYVTPSELVQKGCSWGLLRLHVAGPRWGHTQGDLSSPMAFSFWRGKMSISSGVLVAQSLC